MENEKPTTSGLKEKIGQVVKQMRDERGLSQDQLGEKIGTDKGNVSRMENKGQGTIERLGKIARTLGVQLTDIIAQAEGVHREDRPDPQLFKIPLLANSGSMGGGAPMLDDDLVIGTMSIKKDWVDKNLQGISAPGKLRFIHACGESMQPTFGGGDILLVDTGVTHPDIDGIYVLEARGELYIKRVSRRFSGQHEVTSDNPLVKTVEVLNGDNQVATRGRIVWGWNGKKL